MKRKYIYILILALSLNSCEFSINTNKSPKSEKVGLGKMPKVESKTYENIYIADEILCKEQKLPLTRFAIEYPNGLDVSKPKNGSEHIGIKKKANGIIIEDISIGNTTIVISTQKNSLELIENLVADFKRQNPKMETISISKKKFNGEMTYLFEGKFDFSGYKEHGYDGIYKAIFLIPIPKKNEKINAVIISFLANEQSEIKEFSDFYKKGVIGNIYKTFRYLE
ncbi:hypothetical protein [Olleya sp. R77988]|uniref:hypothetical protein n=1 Tax=Olleya sp. R77988 TaxID=3093875 RepID=UPI0037C7349D